MFYISHFDCTFAPLLIKLSLYAKGCGPPIQYAVSTYNGSSSTQFVTRITIVKPNVVVR